MLSDVPFPLLLPLLALAGVVFYLGAVLDQTRAENTSTRRLRLIVFLFGLMLCCIGALCSHFEIPWRGRAYALARPYSSADDFLYWVFMFVGSVAMVSTPLWSRKRLVREARHLASSGNEFNVADEDVVTPAQRVEAMRKRLQQRPVGTRPDNPD